MVPILYRYHVLHSTIMPMSTSFVMYSIHHKEESYVTEIILQLCKNFCQLTSSYCEMISLKALALSYGVVSTYFLF